jgi:hypothetical protein
MEGLEKFLNKSISNPVVYSFLAMFLAMYSPRLAPTLPSWMMNLFQNNIFRFMVLLLVVYLSSKDLQLSLLIVIAFVLIISIVNYQNTQETFRNYLEQFENQMQTPLESTSVASNRANGNDMMNNLKTNTNGEEETSGESNQMEYFTEATNGENFEDLQRQEESILRDLRERYANPY